MPTPLSDKERQMADELLLLLKEHRDSLDRLIGKIQEVHVLHEAHERATKVINRHIAMAKRLFATLEEREVGRSELLESRLNALLESVSEDGLRPQPPKAASEKCDACGERHDTADCPAQFEGGR